MRSNLFRYFLVASVFGLLCGQDAQAITRRAKRVGASAGLAAVCPKIQSLNISTMFWKNNKPKRASSAFNAPVIGYYEQMTLAGNAGTRVGFSGGAQRLYDSQGNLLSMMTPYSCRSDHCSRDGRVVSQANTRSARRAAVSRTGSPTGYVSLGRGNCVKIDDIGRCYGNSVNKGRPLCNQVVG